MSKRRLFSLIIVSLILTHLLAPVAAAHPLGNFTINHYAGLHVTQEMIQIDFVLDMAEIPAFQEIAGFDANKNGQADPAEVAGYHPTQCEIVRAGLSLSLNGRPLPLSLTSSAVEFPPGAGDLPTLRLSCAFQAPIEAARDAVQITFENNLYAQRLGWREIVVSGDGVSLRGDLADVSGSISQRLTAYPDDLLTSPLDQRQVSFDLIPAGGGRQPVQTTALAGQPAQSLVDRNDEFTKLITLQHLTWPTMLLALAGAFVWGAAHALTPGHGKTIVAAYLVGSRGTVRHAIFLGLTTTITHTAGVFILGFLTLFASRFILPEQLYPWLGVGSGALVVGIGLSLFKGRLSDLILGQTESHPHHHDHTPEGTRDHNHDHDHDHGHDHTPPERTPPERGTGGTGDHGHDHDLYHSHTPDTPHPPLGGRGGGTRGTRGHGPTHTHLPPDHAGAITWRSLLALGVSGGLIPCPSALIVMLSAIALQRVGFGLVLIMVFSLGLAGVLTAIGVAWVQARRLFELIPKRIPYPVPHTPHPGGHLREGISERASPRGHLRLFARLPGHRRLLQALPAGSALFITLIGVGITWQALIQTGVLAL